MAAVTLKIGYSDVVVMRIFVRRRSDKLGKPLDFCDQSLGFISKKKI